MKKLKTRYIAILSALLVFLIISSFIKFDNQIYPDHGNNYYRNLEIVRTSGNWDLTGTPIIINGNSDWALKAASEPWCSGSGTWTDPYIIENVTINGLNSTDCITISNSDVYFIIQNSTLYNASAGIEPNNNAGIKLENVSNGKILNNNCSNNNWFGIYIDHGSNNSIIGNVISYNHKIGIQTYESDYNYLSGNIVVGNDNSGLKIDYSYESIIIGNTVTNNNYGIAIQETDAYEYNKSLVKNNNCSHNQAIGILLSSKHIDIIGNIANDNFYGIQISHYGNCFIYGNTANNNRKYGIFVNCDNNQIYYNNVSYNGEIGIYLYDLYSRSVKNNTIKGNIGYNNSASAGIALFDNCNFNKISENLLSENHYGISLENSFNNTIFANNASNNNQFGINLYQSENNTLSENIVKDNDNEGIYLYKSDYNTVNGTVLTGNLIGLYLYESDHNMILKNSVVDNDRNACNFHNSHKNALSENLILHNGILGQYDGLFLHISENNSILRNFINNNTYNGISLSQSNKNIINENVIKYNSMDGVYLIQQCDNNTISENTIQSNQRFGVFLEFNSKFNDITWNYIEDNARGIEVYSNSNNNFIAGNDIIRNNGEGMYLVDCIGLYIIRNLIINNSADGILIHNCNDSKIDRNYLIGNLPNAVDNGVNNEWNWGSEGNYWDDYSGVDDNDDGIGDTPYIIPGTAGSQDNFPIYDDKAPLVSIHLPLNGTCIDSRPRINVSAFDPNWDTIWYEINGQQVTINYGVEVLLDDQIWTGLADGPFIMKIYATDLIGHINDSYSLILYKDTANPIISITNPIEDQEFGAQAPTYDFDIDELCLDTIWYVIVSEESTPHIISSTSGAINEVIWDSLDDGYIIIRFYANDTLGHESYAEVSITKNTYIEPGPEPEPVPEIPGFDTFTIIAMISLITTILIWRKKLLNFNK